jgi:hypothetical protein
MKTTDYASSVQSTKKTPTKEYDLAILGGARDPISAWTL